MAKLYNYLYNCNHWRIRANRFDRQSHGFTYNMRYLENSKILIYFYYHFFEK